MKQLQTWSSPCRHFVSVSGLFNTVCDISRSGKANFDLMIDVRFERGRHTWSGFRRKKRAIPRSGARENTEEG
jgi:hypothetical protein